MTVQNESINSVLAMFVQTDTLLLSSLIASALVLAIAFISVFHLRQQLREMRKNYQKVHRELRLANSSAIGVGQRLIAVERKLKSQTNVDLGSRYTETKPLPSEQLGYSEALQFLDSGASVAEIVQRCNISHTEAMLLQTLYSQKQHASTMESALNNHLGKNFSLRKTVAA